MGTSGPFLLVFVTSLMTLTTMTSVSANDVENLLDPVITAGIGCHRVAGMSVAAVSGGQVVVAKGYGVADLQTRQPVTGSTLFGIASLTKAFTATLLARQLEEDRTKGFGTNLHRVFGRNQFNNTLRSVYATIEDLVSHRMGIPRHNYLRLSISLSRTNLVRRVKYLRHQGGFRDSFYYSDLMYGLATRISEVLGGDAWEDVMASKLLRPLGMSATNFSTRLSPCTDHCATPYVWESGELVPASPLFIRHWAKIGGSGAMLSNAEDMAKWLLFQLGDGRSLQGERVLQASTLRDAHKARNPLSGSLFRRPEFPVTMSNDGYALGWKTGYYRGLRLVQHTGSTFGYKAMLSLLPDVGIGVFTSMNGLDTGYRFRRPLHALALDALLGETPWVNASTICSFPAPWQAARGGRRRRRREAEEEEGVDEEEGVARRTAQRRPLRMYRGRYNHHAYGQLVVTYSNGRLEAEYGIARWRLSGRGGDKFQALWTGDPPKLHFQFEFLGGSRSVTALKIRDFEKSDPPVFYRLRGS